MANREEQIKSIKEYAQAIVDFEGFDSLSDNIINVWEHLLFVDFIEDINGYYWLVKETIHMTNREEQIRSIKEYAQATVDFESFDSLGDKYINVWEHLLFVNFMEVINGYYWLQKYEKRKEEK